MSALEHLCTTKTNAVVLKTYNKSNIEELGIWTVKLRHKNNVAKCRSSVVPGNDPGLLGMSNIEVLGILKIIYEVINSQKTGRNFDSQIMQPKGVLKIKNTWQKIREHRVGMLTRAL